MKKLFTIAAFFILISCTHHNQTVSLELSFDDKKSNVGNGAGISLSVFDDRLEGKIIGAKEFCNDDKISIFSEQNLAELLQQKISENLLRRGFKKGNDKLVEVHIESFRYNALCNFVLGNSGAEAIIKVVITDAKSGSKITKNFEVSFKNKHFLIPLASTDANTINGLLQEVIGDILGDTSLLEIMSSK